MANPTPLAKNRTANMDNLALEVEQLIVNGSVVASAQQDNIAAVAAPAAYAAADISASYVEAEVQAVADALEALRDEVAALVTSHNAVLTALEDFGALADA